MSIQYKVESTQIFCGDSTKVYIEGWCYSSIFDVIDLEASVNGKKQKVDVHIVPRMDVQVEEEVRVLGFQVHFELKEALDSLAIQLMDNHKEKETILSLDKETIKEYMLSEYVLHIDNSTYDLLSDTYIVNGWHLNLESHQDITFKVFNNENKEVPCTCRNTIRKDIVSKYHIDKDETLCGFMLTFKVEGEGNYTLKSVDEDGNILHEEKVYVEKPNKVPFIKKVGGYLHYLNKDTFQLLFEYIHVNGFKKTVKRVLTGQAPSSIRLNYDNWFKNHQVSKFELNQQSKEEFTYAPKISIITPTFNTPIEYLEEMIDTVIHQSYPNWELCIADASNKDHPVRQKLQEYVEKDNRIKVKYLDSNLGISGNSNEALSLATGEYIGLYDHDDFLELDALYEIVKHLQEYSYDVLYTDEDKFNEDKKKYEFPHLKPDYSIDLLRSYNYITHFFIAKKELIDKVGGFRKEFDGSQDHDLIFRCIEQANKVCHVSKILYHWRMHSNSTAANPESKLYCYEAGQKAVQGNLERNGLQADVELEGAPHWGCYYVDYKVEEEPKISILIPNYENKKVLERCINSLLTVNTYKNYEVIIIENNSTSKEIFDYYDKIQKEHTNIKVITWEGKGFNYSALNNFGASYATGEYLLLLNNDTEMIEPESLHHLVSYCQREDVGVVGAKLLFPNDTIQHAGVVIGFGSVAGHVFSNFPRVADGYFNRLHVVGDWSAVTGACLMTKKALYEQVGGLDENLKVAFNDIDYCLKIRSLNKLVVLNPRSLWYHYESVSRGYENDFSKIQRFEGEIKTFQTKWKAVLIDGDPYYNSNFDVGYTPFELH